MSSGLLSLSLSPSLSLRVLKLKDEMEKKFLASFSLPLFYSTYLIMTTKYKINGLVVATRERARKRRGREREREVFICVNFVSFTLALNFIYAREGECMFKFECCKSELQVAKERMKPFVRAN